MSLGTRTVFTLRPCSTAGPQPRLLRAPRSHRQGSHAASCRVGRWSRCCRPGRAYTACPRDRFRERPPGVHRPSQGEFSACPLPVLRPRRCRLLPRPATAAARHVPLLRAAAAPHGRRCLRRPVTSLCSRPSPAKDETVEASPAPQTATRGVLCLHLVAAGRPACIRDGHGRKRRRGRQLTRSRRQGDPKT